MKSGTGAGRRGPGLLGGMHRPPIAERSSAAAQAADPPDAGGDAGARDVAPPGQQTVDTRQGRWLPRHQPWNAKSASVGSLGRSIEALATQLAELDEMKQAGLLTEEEFARQRAWLLAT